MNDAIFFFFHNLAHQSQFVDAVIIFFAKYFPYAVLIAAGIFLLMHHEVLKAEAPAVVFMEKKKEFFVLFFSASFAYIAAKLLKILFHTARPFVEFPQVQSLFAETGYAFPSGHTAVFSAIAFTIFFTHKKAGYFFISFALLIGLVRIMAGVHFPIDILGGFVLGAIVAVLVNRFWNLKSN
jgi:undecaprenyl-diphosphatase